MRQVYADANATFPVDAAHYERVLNTLKEMDGNPSSIHSHGRQAKVALERARASLAKLLGARAPEIVFTSGATEANNLAVQGVIGRTHGQGQVPHVVMSATEHPSILDTAELFAERGLCRLAVAPVQPHGEVDPEALLKLIEPETVLVCVMHGNNEVGAINPVADLAAAIKQENVRTHVHVDAVQTLGKLDLSRLAGGAIDSAALSAHKIGGFKGVGALYLKAGTKLNLLMAGGGQERGRRPGTENLPGIISFGLRCDELLQDRDAWVERMRTLRDLWLAALAKIPGAVIHGEPARGLPNTVNFHIGGVPGEDILLNFDLAGISASSGSACSAGVGRPSHVLSAMGYDDWTALNSVRVSFDCRGDAGDVEHMTRILQDIVKRGHAPA